MNAQDEVAHASMHSPLAAFAMRATRLVLGFVLLAMVVLNVANAVARYAFGAVLIVADEVLVFGMVWLVMVGLILVTADRSHIALDFLPNRVGMRARLMLMAVHYAVIFAVCSYAALQSFRFVQRVAALGQTSMGLALPMYIPHSALVVGFGGAALVALVLLADDLKTLFADRPRSGP